MVDHQLKSFLQVPATLLDLLATDIVIVLAPVAQRIEHRPPEPVAGVRVAPGARNDRGVAQPGSALRLGRRSPGFESRLPDQRYSRGPIR